MNNNSNFNNAQNNNVQRSIQNNTPSNNKKQVHVLNNTDFTKMPVVEAVNTILLSGIKSGGSDIHFDPTDDGIIVRIRIDGELRNTYFLPLEIKQNTAA